MSFLSSPMIYPDKSDSTTIQVFFDYLITKPELPPIKSASQLDEMPTDLDFLALFHEVKLEYPLEASIGRIFYALIFFCILLIVGSFLVPPQIQGVVFTSGLVVGVFGFLLVIIVGSRTQFARIRKTGKASLTPEASSPAKRWHEQGGMHLGMGWMIVDKPEYTYGDTIRFIYYQKAVKPTRLMSGLVRLVLIEATRDGFVTSPIYNYKAIEISCFEIPAGSYKPDEAIRVRGELTLPTYGPSVLIEPRNRMAYMLEVKLEVTDQPTRELLYHLPVEPAVENGVVRS